MAKVARFYGWSHNEIERMRVNDFDMYYRAITPIEAQELLLELTVSDFPNMKKGQRKKIHGQLQKASRPAQDQEQQPMTLKRLAAIIGSAGELGSGRK